jgi:hypothetical protein
LPLLIACLLVGGFVAIRLAVILLNALAALPTVFWVIAIAAVLGAATITGGIIAIRRAERDS